VEATLGAWFQTGNLLALRELALLWLAATLASDPRRHRPGDHDPGGGCARERVVVALSGGSDGGQRRGRLYDDEFVLVNHIEAQFTALRYFG
jgi:two-component system sensor histidine kinase KdpD